MEDTLHISSALSIYQDNLNPHIRPLTQHISSVIVHFGQGRYAQYIGYTSVMPTLKYVNIFRDFIKACSNEQPQFQSSHVTFAS